MIDTYFSAERSGGLLFIIIGILALGLAIWGWQQGLFWSGAAWPFAVVALIQISVGVTFWLRSVADLQRVQVIVFQEQERIDGEEVPRMQAILKSYSISLRIEIIFFAVGLVLLMLATHGSLWKGAGFGLAVQAGLILLLDNLAERRAQTYLDWLLALRSPGNRGSV